ncbi:hypothetical protein C488_03330 [Natrinema pellirubrum DSM 15624]|uniref:Archaeal flagellin-like protein n=1 Tax=Natrinema pellirubrum (strain DSM 15624 / CIP 106293 / JCM 10476 / NCIMB 786 / 157) TaxID=797303 RepID=L0JKF4_NATP1|nr:type IV pilin N-terminal domain-containing protein [Natrinema pellirubrum]AGB30826.1 archaeal flagellin-like protein [Natrinema pellirubrum DSM 15624]ELY80788.1 hypothetical protein C488_03330 [Natrinema pellirubrum DSM 15624]
MDGKQIKMNLIGDSEERAVSPVIGVILMVAITVILAAVIAAFVLDLGQSQGANAQAGMDFNEDSDQVTITINSVERADKIQVGTTVSSSDCSNGGDLPYDMGTDVGGTFVLETDDGTINNGGDQSCDFSDSDEIQIIGVYDGSDNVITTYNPN